MVIHYNPTGKNSWNVRFNGRLAARIAKRNGALVATFTRSAGHVLCESVARWMYENGK